MTTTMKQQLSRPLYIQQTSKQLISLPTPSRLTIKHSHTHAVCKTSQTHISTKITTSTRSTHLIPISSISAKKEPSNPSVSHIHNFILIKAKYADQVIQHRNIYNSYSVLLPYVIQQQGTPGGRTMRLTLVSFSTINEINGPRRNNLLLLRRYTTKQFQGCESTTHVIRQPTHRKVITNESNSNPSLLIHSQYQRSLLQLQCKKDEEMTGIKGKTYFPLCRVQIEFLPSLSLMRYEFTHKVSRQMQS